MTTDPSQLRAEIEHTRSRLSDNVDALADQANPAHIAKRQVSKARAAAGRFLDRVLGTAEDVRDATADSAQHAVASVQDAAQGVVDRIADAPRAARRETQGNPIAAGVVAFGLGLLVAAAFPPSRKEKELAQTVKEQAQPLTDQLAAAGQEIAQNLAEPAQQAVDALKGSATEAVQRVQDEGASAVSDVQQVVKESTGEVAETARQSVEQVRDEAGPALTDDRG